MNYFVIAPDGQRYGPADTTTLNAWIADGRLHAQSFLEEEATGRRLPASSLPDLRFGPSVPPIGPAGAYPRYGGYPASGPMMAQENDHSKILGAFGLGIAAIVVAIFIGYLSFFLSIWGVQLAWAAKERGHALGWVAVIFNVLVIVAVIVIRFGFRSMRVT